MRQSNKILSGLKLVYLDVMEKGMFLRQVKWYTSSNELFPKNIREIEREAMVYVKKTFPSLANRDIDIKFSNNRIFH